MSRQDDFEKRGYVQRKGNLYYENSKLWGEIPNSEQRREFALDDFFKKANVEQLKTSGIFGGNSNEEEIKQALGQILADQVNQLRTTSNVGLDATVKAIQHEIVTALNAADQKTLKKNLEDPKESVFPWNSKTTVESTHKRILERSIQEGLYNLEKLEEKKEERVVAKASETKSAVAVPVLSDVEQAQFDAIKETYQQALNDRVQTYKLKGVTQFMLLAAEGIQLRRPLKKDDLNFSPDSIAAKRLEAVQRACVAEYRKKVLDDLDLLKSPDLPKLAELSEAVKNALISNQQAIPISPASCACLDEKLKPLALEAVAQGLAMCQANALGRKIEKAGELSVKKVIEQVLGADHKAVPHILEIAEMTINSEVVMERQRAKSALLAAGQFANRHAAKDEGNDNDVEMKASRPDSKLDNKP